MDNLQGAKLSGYISLVIGGCFLVLVICRVLIIWQKKEERNWRAFWFMMIHFCIAQILFSRFFHF
jgi:hypothetical protein